MASLNLETMRRFWQAYPEAANSETPSRDFVVAPKSETPSRISHVPGLAARWPLSWSHYVHLVRHTRSAEARAFYETEALRGGWSVRQLERQIDSQFYERTLPNKVLAAEYRTTLPDAGQLAEELTRTRRLLERADPARGSR